MEETDLVAQSVSQDAGLSRPIVLTVKITVFWDSVPCCLVEVCQNLRNTCVASLHGTSFSKLFREDGGSTFFRNVGELLPHFRVSDP
jgi:hypothetical protein